MAGSAFSSTGKVWMNGKIVDWADANDSRRVPRHPLRIGGLRGRALLQDAERLGVLPPRRAHAPAVRLGAHLPHGLRASTATPSPQAVVDTVQANGLDACYIRPMHLSRLPHARRESAAVPGGRARFSCGNGAPISAPEALEQGVDVRVSSWTRSAPNTFPAMAKSVANYANSSLIKMEAVARRLQRGHRARSGRPHQRRQRPEPVPRSRRGPLHAAALRVGAAGHHARQRHHARAGPRASR